MFEDDYSVVKAACDDCGLIGPIDMVQHKKEDDKGELEFLVMEFDECGHGVVVAVKDETVNGVIAKQQTLNKRIRALQGSGDLCGLERSLRKLVAVERETKKHMKKLWKSRAHLVSDWPASDELSS